MYKISNRLKLGSFVLMGIGFVGVIYSFVESLSTTGLDEHTLHLLHNKPWAAVYVSALFFMLISLSALVFYAINRVSQAGWSPVLFRVMEGITGYLLPGAAIFLVLLILSSFHLNHMFLWMDEHILATDKVIQGKAGFLNIPFFLTRAFIYVFGWVGYRYISRRLSLKEDNEMEHHSSFTKNIKFSAGFLVFFLVSESMMSWDWVMSFDPHWYSTLFGWYIFMSALVSAIAVIVLVTSYLKSLGYLEYVNDSHFHDLGKYLFGFSIFWTYLWFSQYLLIWYSNIPEEITYYISRIEDFPQMFFGMVVLNFIIPLLSIIDSDMKRKPMVLCFVAICVLVGHYMDFYTMIYPSTVGHAWSIGIGEISSILFFLGLFIYVVFKSIEKAPLLAKGNPFIEESKHFHY